tara:strand:- start:270 stop:488 length:219 start_codon:yes stop_codon:yes gene_type:complete
MEVTPWRLAGPNIYSKINIAIGTANSYCNHINPPPIENPTKAGAPSKLFVEHCVASVDAAKDLEENFLPARK